MMHHKINTQMQNAFWDTLKSNLEDKNKIDVKWLSELYEEIPLRITKWINKKSSFAKMVKNSYDKDLFIQMVSNDAFEISDCEKLFLTTFDFIGQIQSQARDKTLEDKKLKLKDILQDKNATFAEFTVAFLKETHTLLDLVDKDMKIVIEKCKKK